jgi:hypothetical protein
MEAESPLIKAMNKLLIVPPHSELLLSLCHIDKQLAHRVLLRTHWITMSRKSCNHKAASCKQLEFFNLDHRSFESSLRQVHIALILRASSFAQIT